MRLSFSLVFLFTLADWASILTWGTQTPPGQLPDWWVESGTSPLKIKQAQSGRWVILENQSSGRVIQYQLGCVLEHGARFHVVCKMKTEQTDLPPYVKSDQKIYSVVHRTLDGKEKDECEKIHGKLSVIKVWFADGSIWLISNPMKNDKSSIVSNNPNEGAPHETEKIGR